MLRHEKLCDRRDGSDSRQCADRRGPAGRETRHQRRVPGQFGGAHSRLQRLRPLQGSPDLAEALLRGRHTPVPAESAPASVGSAARGQERQREEAGVATAARCSAEQSFCLSGMRENESGVPSINCRVYTTLF